jgi:hypothetical protein
MVDRTARQAVVTTPGEKAVVEKRPGDRLVMLDGVGMNDAVPTALAKGSTPDADPAVAPHEA